MLLLEQKITTKKRVDKNVAEFKASNGQEYEVEVIQESVVYATKRKGHLPSLYYLVLWKKYLKEKNTLNHPLQFST